MRSAKQIDQACIHVIFFGVLVCYNASYRLSHKSVGRRERSLTKPPSFGWREPPLSGESNATTSARMRCHQVFEPELVWRFSSFRSGGRMPKWGELGNENGNGT